MLDVISETYVRMLNPIQLLNEDMLMEDRIDWLKQNTKSINIDHDMMAVHIEPHAIINFMANHVDPTRNKIHTQHLIRMYNNGAFRQEDAPRVKETLSNFEKYKSKLPVEQRDLGKFNSIASIQGVVEPHIGTAATKKESRELLKNKLDIPGKHELKYDDDRISIYHLKDRETSQKLYAQKTANNPGAYPTEWCTAAAPPRDGNMFDHYHSRGNMFVVHRKSDGAVFQYHPESDQFMDKIDKTISNDDFESIKSSLHKAWDDKSKNLLDNTKSNKNSDFLNKYAEPDRHFTFEDSPMAYLKPSNTNTTTEQLHQALNQNQPFLVRSAAIKHPNVTSDHIDKALDDPDLSIRISAIERQNATPDNIHKALNDNHTDVVKAAMYNDNANAENISKALTHTDPTVRYVAILHQNVTPHHIDKALDDPEQSVRNYAIKSQSVNDNHIRKALTDPVNEVRLSAIGNPAFDGRHLKQVINDDTTPNVLKEYAVSRMINQNKKINGITKLPNLYIDNLHDISDEKIKLAKHYAHNLSIYSSSHGGITSDEVAKYIRPDVNEAAKLFANKIGESEIPKFGRIDQRTAGSLSVLMKHRALESEHIKHIAKRIINHSKGEYNHIGAIEALYDNRLKPEHAKEIVDAANKYDSPYNEQINNTYKRRFMNK